MPAKQYDDLMAREAHIWIGKTLRAFEGICGAWRDVLAELEDDRYKRELETEEVNNSR